MPVTLVVGGQWGDEGKAKIIDYLARGMDIVVRYQGGANAGHTVVVGNERFAFRQVPSGILYPRVTCVLGGGMVIDPHALMAEIDDIRSRGVDVEGRILVSAQAHLVMPYHILLDCESEDRRSASAEGGIGTTRKGISPAYADKARREGIRASDLTRSPADLRALVEDRVRENNKILKFRGVKTLKPKQVTDDLMRVRKPLLKMITDTRPVLWSAVEARKHVLCEGAQGSLLDIDHGTYPFVTSSSCTAGGAAIGTGLPPAGFDAIVGIFKAYCTRVGNGPFPTEDKGAAGRKLREVGREYGTVTGRPRRCGWFDGVAARTVVKLNGITDVALTKLDVLDTFDSIKVCTSYRVGKQTIDVFPADARTVAGAKPQYEELPGWKQPTTGCKLEDLPDRAMNYIRRMEALIGCRIHLVSLGPERSAMLQLPHDNAPALGA
ncbi:MAG TPA: adenylosuccinate synthase [Candidatus Krumholzibacteria bacterium]